MKFSLIALTLVLPLLADPLFDRAATKIERIQSGNTKPGEVVVITPEEMNAYARGRAASIDGVRNPKVELGAGVGSGAAVIDLARLRNGNADANPIVSMLLEGERPVKISVRMQSAMGQCIVHLTSVEISGLALTGSVLDFLLSNVFLPMFPNAKVGEAFDLREPIERLELTPEGLRVVMKK